MFVLLVFEFENTLVDSKDNVFPFVTEALKAIDSFQTGTGDKLGMCLISAKVPSAGDIERASSLLIRRLEKTGLKSFFEPVSKRVTVSGNSHPGGIDHNLLQIAVSRSGSGAALEQCILFTADREAAEAAQTSGLRTFVYGENGAPGVDFADWSEAALLVAKFLDSNRLGNLKAALRLHLEAKANLDLVSLTSSADPNTFRGKVNVWRPISSEKLGEVSGVNVRVPAEVTVQLDASGKLKNLVCEEPSPTDKEEAQHFVESLVTHGQIAPESALPPRGATHQINTDSEGRRYLIRKRFTAV